MYQAVMVLTRRIRIRLDGGNDQTLHPEARPSGVVEYRSPSVDILTSLQLVFRGVSKVLPRKGSQTAQEHIELFHITQVLLPEPLQAKPGQLYNWHFTFDLPRLTGPDRSDELYVDRGNPLFEERAHPLPPYFGADQSDAVRIEYHMYAVAQRSYNLGLGVPEQCEGPIVFNIDNVKYVPDVPELPDQPAQLLEKTFDVWLPQRRKLSLRSPSSADVTQQPPLHTFTLVAHLPATLALGEDLAISFSVRKHGTHTAADDGTLSATPPYLIFYKTANLVLIALTHRRTAHVAHDPAALTEARTKTLGPDLDRGTGPLDSIPIVRHFPTAAARAWPPSFKSYSVARAYALQVEVTVLCEKQAFTARLEGAVAAVRRVTPETALARHASHAPPPPLEYQGPRDEMEALPSYEEVSRQPSLARQGSVASPMAESARA